MKERRLGMKGSNSDCEECKGKVQKAQNRMQRQDMKGAKRGKAAFTPVALIEYMRVEKMPC